VSRMRRSPGNLNPLMPRSRQLAATLTAVLFGAGASARWQWAPQLQLSANLLNAFNAMPPEDRSYPRSEAFPYNELNYNVYGRSFFVGAQYKFRR
jgi:iron complex outermembrane receptor protein